MKATKRTQREAKQLLRLCIVDGVVDERRGGQLLQRLLKDKPRGCLAVLAGFERLLKIEQARHSALVESATPLPPDISNRLQARLAEAYGPGLRCTFAQAPALLGGIRITVGSDVYDGSVQGRLAALGRRFS